MFKKVLSLSLLFASFLAYAEDYTYINDLQVHSVFAGYEQKNAYFETNKDIANPANCGGSSGSRLIAVDPARSDVNQVLSILLYAHAVKKPVDIQIYDESCFKSYRVIRRVKVRN